MDELKIQNTLPAEVPPRLAVHTMEPVPDSKDFFLFARRSGDKKEFAFRAVANGPLYYIHVYDETVGTKKGRLVFEQPVPLEVMTSSEAGAGNRPMTGDYDLMSVCPKWGNYGSTTLKPITKEGLDFTGKGVQKGLTFDADTNMDKVLDMRTNTGAKPAGGVTNKTFQGLTKRDGGRLDEHGDMGNLTPRILRCINMLNIHMGATGARSALRRVHHNAESHRNAIFGALTASQMDGGDGFPLTVFQPRALLAQGSPVRVYEDVCTLESMIEFRQYATLLNMAGYYVPKNWTWGMSIRDRFK
jgi:hypothetical protein